MDIDALLARRVRELRKARDLTLEQLAEANGVSRSVISLIERQETKRARWIWRSTSCFSIRRCTPWMAERAWHVVAGTFVMT